MTFTYKVYERNLPYFNLGVKTKMKTSEMDSNKLPSLRDISTEELIESVNGFIDGLFDEIELPLESAGFFASYDGKLRGFMAMASTSEFEQFTYIGYNNYLLNIKNAIGGVISDYSSLPDKQKNKACETWDKKFEAFCKEHFK